LIDGELPTDQSNDDFYEGLRRSYIRECGLEGKDLERTLEAYVPVTESQRLAKEAIEKAVLAWPEPKTSFYIWGAEDDSADSSYGAGKSHLAKAYMLGVMQSAYRIIKGKHYRIGDFIEQLHYWNRNNPDVNSPVVIASKASLLVFDDLDKGMIDPQKGERQQEAFKAIWRVLDYRSDQSKPTVITSNYSIEELEQWLLGHSGTSRLSHCVQLHVIGPDGRKRG
jgi:chromosomal replication initiation ATPase DnaA